MYSCATEFFKSIAKNSAVLHMCVTCFGFHFMHLCTYVATFIDMFVFFTNLCFYIYKEKIKEDMALNFMNLFHNPFIVAISAIKKTL